MGIKEITRRIEQILGKKRKARLKRAATLAKLLEKLEAKRRKLKKKLSDESDSKERRKLKARLRATEVHLAKGREELKRLS